jgi:hypothetical protein
VPRPLAWNWREIRKGIDWASIKAVAMAETALQNWGGRGGGVRINTRVVLTIDTIHVNGIGNRPRALAFVHSNNCYP